jgi:TrmH family RNA methyltransferase
MAGGGRDVLESAQFVPDVASAIGDCDLAVGCTARMRRWDWPIWEPAALGAEAMRREGNLAILFGREDMGLENEDLAYCQALLRIPTDGEPSLNLSQAVLLVCGALFQSARDVGWIPTEEDRQTTRSAGRGRSRMPRSASPPLGPSAPLAMQQALVEQAVSVLSRTSYMNGRNEEQVRVALGQMLQKLHPTEKESTILLGMAKKTRIRLAHLDGGEE